MLSTTRHDLFSDSWALHGGMKGGVDGCQWSRLGDIGWSLSEQGFLHGAILVERLRTYHGNPFCISEHESRLKAGAMALGLIKEPESISASVFSGEQGITSFSEATHRVLERNRSMMAVEEDVGIVWLLSPGDSGWDLSLTRRPTWIVHLVPLPWTKLHKMYSEGSVVVRSPNQNVPAACWSPSIKSRSRLHYYLAEQQAAQQTQHRDAIPLLVNQSGFVTECPIGNLLLVDSMQQLWTPKADDILGGVSLAYLRGLAVEAGFSLFERNLTWDDVLASSEVLLTGTTAGLWPVSSVDGRELSSRLPGSIYEQLSRAWEAELAFSYREQAARRAMASMPP